MNVKIIKKSNMKLIIILLFLFISSFCNFKNNLVDAQVFPGNDKAISLKWESTSNSTATITWTAPVNSGNSLVKYLLTVTSDETSFTDIDKLDVGLVTSYSLNTLVEGKKYFVKVEPIFNPTDSSDYNFENTFIQTYFTQPLVVDFGVITGNGRIKGTNLTKIPVGSNVFVRIKDDKAINLPTKEIILRDKIGNVVTGTNSTAQLDPVDSKQIDLIFDPTLVLDADEKYTVTINVVDSDGKKSIPIEFSFKTDKTFTGYVSGDPKENPNEAIRNKNPHGVFLKNNNACFACHGTQKALSLNGNIKTIQDASTQFCLTCHDGTVSTSIQTGNFQHGFNAGGSSMGTAQCSDCHDSHLGWSESNPNLLKSRVVYNHKTKAGVDILKDGVWVGVVDSASSINCFTCHREETGRVINLATVDATNNNYYQSDAIKPFNNNKMATTKGKEDDVNLCLSCHKSGGKGKNIKDTYLTPESGHKIIFGDRYDILGGGLEGYLTCSDCHETHGSNNVYLLKESLGHENAVAYSGTQRWASTVTDAAKERTFCLKCHDNNNKLYGVTAAYNTTTIKEHRDAQYTSLACSEIGCHGSGSNDLERYLKGAHAPIKKPIPR